MQSAIDADRLFIPRQAIRSEKALFAGRKDFILRAVEETQTPGTSLVLFGERGVGKTSLGWQLYDILNGDTFLLSRWRSPVPLKRHYRCYWLQCEENMVSVEGALLRLLMHSELGASIFDQHKSFFTQRGIYNSFKRKYKIDLGVVGGEFEFLSSLRTTPSDAGKAFLEKRASIRSLFSEVLSEIKGLYPKDDILIFLDEADVLPIKEGFGSLIKETNIARFVILGIFDSPGDILYDHPSADRKVANLPRVPGLSKDEINWILDRAESVYPDLVRFAPDFRTSLVEKAQGFSWLVQALGHAAVKAALRQHELGSVLTVYSSHLKTSIRDLVDPKRDDKRYRNLYNILTSDQVSKIEILQILAQFDQRWMRSTELIEKVEQKRRRYVSANLGELATLGIISEDDNSVKFSDPISRLIVQLDADDR